MVESGRRSLALVTGASNGIGRAMAADFARRGFDLVTTGRSATIHQVTDECTAWGAQVVPVQADLGTAEGIEALWAAVEQRDRPVAVAAVHAGVGLGGAFVDTDLDEERRLIQLNITGVVHLVKHLARHMTRQAHGRILITSSISATLPTPYETVYGPSRAFTRLFAHSLREELRGTGVTVTTLLPGATNSDFHARAGMGATAFGPNAGKNDLTTVARQGVAAVLAGQAEVIGGDRATKRTALWNRLLPEPVKAARHARKAKPPRSARNAR